MSRTITVETTGTRKPVAYQNKAYGHVYFPGTTEQGGGVLHAGDGPKIFTPYSYLYRIIFENDSYIPLYEGDKVEITL